MHLKTLALTGLVIGTVTLAGCSAAGTEQASTTNSMSGMNHAGMDMGFSTPGNEVAAPINVVVGSDPAPANFGTISMQNGKVSQVYILKNGSDVPRTLTAITTSCMCTDAVIDGQTFGMHYDPAANVVIAPGETKTLTVTFDPNAHGPDAVGPISREVSITSDDPNYPQTKIKFTGMVTK